MGQRVEHFGCRKDCALIKESIPLLIKISDTKSETPSPSVISFWSFSQTLFLDQNISFGQRDIKTYKLFGARCLPVVFW